MFSCHGAVTEHRLSHLYGSEEVGAVLGMAQPEGGQSSIFEYCKMIQSTVGDNLLGRDAIAQMLEAHQ